MRRTLKLLVVVMMAVTISGCSVGMALHGREEIDLASLRIGQHRAEVVLIAGQPEQTLTLEKGIKDVFRCQRGNSPSVGRAIGHAAMDVLTFGGWEVIGVPVEAFGTRTYYLTVTYDEENKVTDIKTSREKGGLN